MGLFPLSPQHKEAIMTENRNPEGSTQGAPGERVTPYLDLSLLRGTKDMARGGLFLAVISLVLTMVLFAYGRNLLVETAGRVDALGGAYEQRLGNVEARLASMEGLPEAVRQAYVDGAVKEMAARVGALSGQVQDEVQKAKLAEIGRLLDELGAGPAK
jgi:hypothetical protein